MAYQSIEMANEVIGKLEKENKRLREIIKMDEKLKGKLESIMDLIDYYVMEELLNREKIPDLTDVNIDTKENIQLVLETIEKVIDDLGARLTKILNIIIQ